MLTGNKFNDFPIYAPSTSGEVNYTDWSSSRSSSGSSYSPKNYGKPYNKYLSGSMLSRNMDRYAYMDTGANNPYKTIDNYKQTLGAVGQTAPLREGAGLGNALSTVLDLMQRPQYAVTNVLDEITDNTKSSFKDVITASLEGLSGKRTSSIKDTFDNIGILQADPTKKWYQGSNLGRNVLGLAGDVLLDPATYLTGGTAALAKGLGTKTIGKEALGQSLEKVLRETGTDAFDVPQSQLVAELSKFLTPNAKTFVKTNAKRQETANYIEGVLSKGGEDATLASRIAYALSKSTDIDSSVLLKENRAVVQGLLDKGMSSLNRDVVDKALSNPLKMQLDNVLAGEYPEALAAFNRTGGQVVTKKFNKVFGFEKTDQFLKKDVIRKLDDIFTVGRKAAVPPEVKERLVNDVYSKVGEIAEPSLFRTISDTEYDVLDTLFNAFDVSNKLQADQLISSSKALARTPYETRAKLHEVVTNLNEAEKTVRRIEGGIEFSNGLQRVFDTADKAFYIKYHNPFTNKVVPLLDITSIARSDKARAAWQMILEANPTAPVARKVAQLGVGVANKFNTEYISRGIGNLGDGVYDEARYSSAKKISQLVTQFMRKENALPRYAANSLKIFNKIPEFFNNSTVRNAASVYIERNNDEYSKAAWLYISGEGITDSSDELVTSAYEQIMSNPNLRKFFDGMKVGNEMLPVIKKIGQQNTLYNKTISQFDGTNKIWFDSETKANRVKISDEELDAETYLARAAAGQIDESSIEGYARIYDKTDRSLLNPVAPPSTDKVRKSVLDDPMAGTRLGKTVDSRASATTDKTGAFMHRSNRSAAEAFITSNGANSIEFDLAARVSRRTLESERVALNKQFVASLEDARRNIEGLDSLISNKEVNGFKAVPLMDGHYTIYAHPEISNQLSRVVSIFDNASVASAAVDEIAINITNALKSMQTKYNPSFILRNTVGEPLMNWVAGVTKQSHDLATQIMKEADSDDLFRIGDTVFATNKGGTKPLYREYQGSVNPGTRERILEYTPNSGSTVRLVEGAADLNKQKQTLINRAKVNHKTYTIGGKNYTALELMNEFYEVGLGWSGVTKGNQAKNMRALLEQEVLGVASGQGIKGTAKVINEKVGKPGDFIETWTRLAHYVDSLNKGMDRFSAAKEVRKFHVDYKDLTQFERKYMRNLMPYYTYMRKNFPIQVKLLIERQNKINIIGQLVDSMYEAVEADNNGKPLVVPDYLKEGIAIPINVDDEGNVQYINWGVPIADIGRFKYNMRELLMENFFSMWSPLVKAPLEYSTNQNMMYGSNLERYEGQGHELLPGVEGSPTIGTMGNQILQSMGIVNTARNALASGVATTQQTGNPAQGLLSGVSKMATGSFMPKKNQNEVAIQQAYDYRDQIYAYIQMLRAQGIMVPQYTPSMKSNPIQPSPFAVADRLNKEGERGYLGTPTAQLYPELLRLLNPNGR